MIVTRIKAAVFDYNKISVFNPDYITEVISENGCWEPNVSRFFIEFIRENPDVNFCDVGSYFGYYSMLYRHSGGKGSGIAIEQNPLPFKMCLEENVKDFLLLNTYIGTTKFSPPMNLYPRNIGGSRPSGTDTGFIVPAIKLKDVSSDIDFYKIDVEGSEGDVLESLCTNGKIHDRCRFILIEVSPCIDAGSAIKAMDILNRNGFKMVDLGCKERGILPPSPEIQHFQTGVDFRQTNLWCFR